MQRSPSPGNAIFVTLLSAQAEPPRADEVVERRTSVILAIALFEVVASHLERHALVEKMLGSSLAVRDPAAATVTAHDSAENSTGASLAIGACIVFGVAQTVRA